MKHIRSYTFILIFATVLFAQAETQIDFYVSDGINEGTTLSLGQDTSATAGIDTALAESELPPPPPDGVFDARLILPNDLPSLVDIRPGQNNFGDSTKFEIDWQLGNGSNGLNLSWFLPEGIEMTMIDFFGGTVVNETFAAGESSYLISNPEVERVKIILRDATVLSAEKNVLQKKFALEQNYPNPFNPTTTINFTIPTDMSNVKLVVYSILGKKVRTLINRRLQSGKHSVTFDGKNLPSGIYFYTLNAGKYVKSRKMILIK